MSTFLIEQTVGRRVPDRELTQEQFDALLSFTYNVGQRGAEKSALPGQ
ncbi:glycoside hydrolase family protein [Massilia sp. MB5]